MTIKEGQVKLAEAMLKPVNPAAIILLGLFTMLWGFWVGNPFWHVFSQAPLYSFMSHSPEWVWGITAFIAGIVICHGAITRRIFSLVLGAGVGGFYWLIVAIMFFLGDWRNTGGITAMVLSVYSFFIYLNLKVNCKVGKQCNDLFSR